MSIIATLASFLGLGVGILLSMLWQKIKTGGFERLAQQIIEKADLEGEKKKISHELALKDKETAHRKELEKKEEQLQKKIGKEEEYLKERENHLYARLTFLEKKLSEIAKKEELLTRKEKVLEEREFFLKEGENKLSLELQKLSSFSEDEAKRHLLEKLDSALAKEKAFKIERAVQETTKESDKIASKIIASAINRLALSTVSDIAIMTVILPSEEMKGRIIGREGRNIRALEQATGVNFLIDETPGAIVISGFDPMRKMIAKLALTELISDGRVHPTRILEVVAKAKESMEKEIENQGEAAAFQAGVNGLSPNLISTLGKLALRYSYGQNVLKHSIEVSLLMGMMAHELGLDAGLARRIGLLHDIGKALSHENEGSHTLLGHDLLLKFGESKEVANGVGSHHGEMLPCTLEGALCTAADTLSGGRPGARGEAIEHYVKRLKDLETIAKNFKGVERAFALQAGREIQVLITPDLFDDASMLNLAREIAKKIESSLAYTDKIKVTIIRESRAVVYT